MRKEVLTRHHHKYLKFWSLGQQRSVGHGFVFCDFTATSQAGQSQYQVHSSPRKWRTGCPRQRLPHQSGMASQEQCAPGSTPVTPQAPPRLLLFPVSKSIHRSTGKVAGRFTHKWRKGLHKVQSLGSQEDPLVQSTELVLSVAFLPSSLLPVSICALTIRLGQIIWLCVCVCTRHWKS